MPDMLQAVQYRSEAEVKLMKTLSTPKKSTPIKPGKIPLVHTKQDSAGYWPAGNPTETKFQREEQYFSQAQDEPYYASKEVERLEDDLAHKNTPKSDIIERITEGRHQRHKKALEDLHEELGHLNKATDPQVAEAFITTKEQLERIIQEIKILYFGIERDKVLYTYPLRQLEMLWDDVVGLLQKRATSIDELGKSLNDMERERRDRISDIFQHYNLLFREIAYLSGDAIDVLMDREVYSSNLLLLSNYKHYVRIISQIKIENVVKLKELRLKWEERLATWRDLHVVETRCKFVNFMSTPAITQCPDITSTTLLMKKELECLYKRRLDKVKQVEKLQPGGECGKLSEREVLRWYEEVCEISLLLENTNSKYLVKLDTVGRAVVRDCEQVADQMLEVLQQEGVCSAEEAGELKTEEMMSLIEKWNSEHKDKLLEIEKTFTNSGAQFTADLHILYEFQSKAASIWMRYQKQLQECNNELISLMKACRAKHDDINQSLESALDMNMDRMRQDTNEGDLQTNLEMSTTALAEIAGAYNNFETDLVAVIKKYPGMIHSELVNYSRKIREHVGHIDGVALESDGNTSSDDMQVADAEPAAAYTEPPYSDAMFKQLDEMVGISFIDHLEVLKCNVTEETQQNVEEKLCELKSEIELRHHIHAPRSMRMKLDIYNVRLNELKAHSERVKQHAAGITLEIATLRNEFKDLGTEHSTKGGEFRKLVEQCECALSSLEKTAQLTSLQTKVTAAHHEHMDQIKFELSTFRNKMEEKLNDLRESNQHFGLAFKPFANGGNFGAGEIEKYRKKLEKCNSKIDNCETFILTELDGMETRCLDTAVEITNNFETKLKMHLLDVAFLEKINSWMSNCQVRIKTEVAACNMMSKKLKTDIGVLGRLIDSCAHPHPDKLVVQPEEVLGAIPALYHLFSERICYLDCATHTQQQLLTITQEPGSDTTHTDHNVDLQSAVNLGKNILMLARKKTDSTADTDMSDKKRTTDVNYKWFICKEEKSVVKRGKSRGDTADRNKRSGSASSRSSLMSIVLTSAQSFMPIIKKILQETQGALFLSSEAYYNQYQGPPLRVEIADSLESCMDNLNKRLNNYYLQTEDYYNKCIQELRGLLSDVLLLHADVPKLLFDQILEKYVTEVSQETCEIKLEFEKNSVKIEAAKETNKVQLKPILGHPNNEVDLNNLCRREEDRMLRAAEIITQFVSQMKTTELEFARIFVDSTNECVKRLLALFDQLITTDDVVLGNVAEKRLAAAVLLKKERRSQLGVESIIEGLSEGGQKLNLLHISNITEESKVGSLETFATCKFTPVHNEVLVARDRICEQYKQHYTHTIQDLENISSQWVASEEKWKKQWQCSVQHVHSLYKPV